MKRLNKLTPQEIARIILWRRENVLPKLSLEDVEVVDMKGIETKEELKDDLNKALFLLEKNKICLRLRKDESYIMQFEAEYLLKKFMEGNNDNKEKNTRSGAILKRVGVSDVTRMALNDKGEWKEKGKGINDLINTFFSVCNGTVSIRIDAAQGESNFYPFYLDKDEAVDLLLRFMREA